MNVCTDTGVHISGLAHMLRGMTVDPRRGRIEEVFGSSHFELSRTSPAWHYCSVEQYEACRADHSTVGETQILWPSSFLLKERPLGGHVVQASLLPPLPVPPNLLRSLFLPEPAVGYTICTKAPAVFSENTVGASECFRSDHQAICTSSSELTVTSNFPTHQPVSSHSRFIY